MRRIYTDGVTRSWGLRLGVLQGRRSKNVKIIITGAKGQLGREITRQFQDKHELLLYDRDALDITDFHAVESLVIGTKPDVLINAAAYTNVEKAEELSLFG